MTDGLHWTHLDAGSVPAWAELTNHLAEVDGTEEFYDAEIEKRQNDVATAKGFVIADHALSLYAHCSRVNCAHRTK